MFRSLDLGFIAREFRWFFYLSYIEYNSDMIQIDAIQASATVEIADKILNKPVGESAVVNLAGGVGTGKTTLLKLIREHVSADKTTIYLGCSRKEVDSSSILLAQLADAISTSPHSNGELHESRNPNQSWQEKFRALSEVVDNHPDDFLILGDEPTRWHETGQVGTDDHPDYNTKKLCDWVFGKAKCRRVISGSNIPTGLPCFDRTYPPQIDDGRDLFADQMKWATAADLAKELGSKIQHPLYDIPIIEVGLYVAWAWLFGVNDAKRSGLKSMSSTSFIKFFLDGLETRKPEVAKAIARLAVARDEVDLRTFDSLMSGLPTLDKDIVKTTLCRQSNSTFALHSYIKNQVFSRASDRTQYPRNECWKTEDDLTNVHETLFGYFDGQPGSIRMDIESLYHGALSSKLDVTQSDKKLHFIEQLQEIGKAVSYQLKDHAKAVQIFRLALSLDEQNAYNHHYLAFNLDWEAKSPTEVESHYKRAIEIQPEHPWWWSRWISYLTTRGRTMEARKTWREAMSELDGQSETTYRALHRWVARWMLHWGDLEMAESILRQIDPPFCNDPSIKILNDLLAALRLAESGIAVFPLSVALESRWAHHHTDLPLKLSDSLQLNRWEPARVQHKDEGKIFIMKGIRPANGHDEIQVEEEGLCRSDIESKLSDCSWEDLTEGRFVEFGYYGLENELRIAIHKSLEWRDPNLLPLVPPADRWYKRAVDESWKGKTGS